jgi:hypothetical protein
MRTRLTDAAEFDSLRPRLLALIEQHRAAPTEQERSRVVGRLEDVFLATAWHVARDLLENGWTPDLLAARPRKAAAALRLVGGVDVA